MFSNVMAVIEFLNLCRDVYLYLDEQLNEADFHAKCRARKERRKIFIATEKEKLKLEVLRDLERNDPRRR